MENSNTNITSSNNRKKNTKASPIEESTEINKKTPSKAQQARDIRQNPNTTISELNEYFGSPNEGFEWTWVESTETKPGHWYKKRLPPTEEEKEKIKMRLQSRDAKKEPINYASNLKHIWTVIKDVPESISSLNPKDLEKLQKKLDGIKNYMKTEVYCVKKIVTRAGTNDESDTPVEE